jgi:hypothetical protein
MNLEEELRENKESIKELTASIKECEAQIKALKKDNMELEARLQADDESDRETIKYLLNGKRLVLSLAEQHLTGLRSERGNFMEARTTVLKLQAEEKFQNSSVHTSLNEGFEYNCRQDLQKELWQLFQVGFADPKNYFQSSRKLVDKEVLEIVKKHYLEKFSGEIDIFLYANPTVPWKLHALENTAPNLHPFTIQTPESPKWSTAIESLNQSTPYNYPITPPSSQYNLDQDVREAQNNLRAVATMYVVFEATHSNKNLPSKFKQLEAQLAYVIIRFHLQNSTKIPSETVEFKAFIAQEVLKLIAFAGVVFVEGDSSKLFEQTHGAIYGKGTPCPALASLYKNGRLCYFNGATFPGRLSLVEAKVESLCFKKGENSPRHFKNMQEFYDALRDNDCDNEDIRIISDVFQKQRIKVKQLQRLTDEKLEKYGFKQRGLREAILAVLGK